MSTLGHIRGISWCIWGSNLINPFNFYWKPQCTHDIPQCTHDIPQCTHDIPWCTEHLSMYSLYPPHAHHDIPQCIHDIPFSNALMVPSNVFNTPWCTHDIPPVYWTSPDALNHTLYRVVLCLYQVHKWKYSSFFFLFNCEFMHF